MRVLRLFCFALAFCSFAGAARAAVTVDVDLATQRMTVYENGMQAYEWPISSGLGHRATPTGHYRPYFLDRTHRSSLYQAAPMPYSVFFRGNYAIHGTTSIRALGHAASHGCVRLHPANAAILFAMVQRNGMSNVSINIVNHAPGAAREMVARAPRHHHHHVRVAMRSHHHHRHYEAMRHHHHHRHAPRTHAVVSASAAPSPAPHFDFFHWQ